MRAFSVLDDGPHPPALTARVGGEVEDDRNACVEQCRYVEAYRISTL